MTGWRHLVVESAAFILADADMISGLGMPGPHVTVMDMNPGQKKMRYIIFVD